MEILYNAEGSNANILLIFQPFKHPDIVKTFRVKVAVFIQPAVNGFNHIRNIFRGHISLYGVLDGQNRPPDGRIVDGDFAHGEGMFEHNVDDQIKTHPGTMAAHRSLTKADHRKLIIRHLQCPEFPLELGDTIGIGADGRGCFIIEFVHRIAVNRAGAGVNKAFHPAEL